MHNGMRPHDIVILLKIAAKGENAWMMKDLSKELSISPGEVSESIKRSVFASLMAQDKKTLIRASILEFIVSGLRYVFPVQPGALQKGMPTAHSAFPLNQQIQSSTHYVWPYIKGTVRGQAIKPLHPNIPDACLNDQAFYELMALCEAIRVGKARERIIAENELKKRLS